MRSSLWHENKPKKLCEDSIGCETCAVYDSLKLPQRAKEDELLKQITIGIGVIEFNDEAAKENYNVLCFSGRQRIESNIVANVIGEHKDIRVYQYDGVADAHKLGISKPRANANNADTGTCVSAIIKKRDSKNDWLRFALLRKIFARNTNDTSKLDECIESIPDNVLNDEQRKLIYDSALGIEKEDGKTRVFVSCDPKTNADLSSGSNIEIFPCTAGDDCLATYRTISSFLLHDHVSHIHHLQWKNEKAFNEHIGCSCNNVLNYQESNEILNEVTKDLKDCFPDSETARGALLFNWIDPAFVDGLTLQCQLKETAFDGDICADFSAAVDKLFEYVNENKLNSAKKLANDIKDLSSSAEKIQKKKQNSKVLTQYDELNMRLQNFKELDSRLTKLAVEFKTMYDSFDNETKWCVKQTDNYILCIRKLRRLATNCLKDFFVKIGSKEAAQLPGCVNQFLGMCGNNFWPSAENVKEVKAVCDAMSHCDEKFHELSREQGAVLRQLIECVRVETFNYDALYHYYNWCAEDNFVEYLAKQDLSGVKKISFSAYRCGKPFKPCPFCAQHFKHFVSMVTKDPQL